MKKWKEQKEPSGGVVYTLKFGHHGNEPEIIVALFKGSDERWLTTSDLLSTYWTPLANIKMCEHDAKMTVEEMVYDHFADKKKYYEEICEEFEREN